MEVEGLCGGLVRVSARRSRIGGSGPTCAMCSQAMDGVSSLGLVSKGLVRSGEHTVVQKAIRTSACLKSQFSYVDSPRSGKRSDRIAWRAPCC